MDNIRFYKKEIKFVVLFFIYFLKVTSKIFFKFSEKKKNLYDKDCVIFQTGQLQNIATIG